MRKLIVAVAALIALTGACANDETATDVPVSAEPSATAASTPAASGAATAGGGCQDDSKPTGQADLEMKDFVFAPSCLEMSTAQGLRIHNEGTVEHNFSVEGFAGLDVDVSPGDENNTEPTGLDPGTYTFFCKYHRDTNGMQGKLVVKSA